MMPEQSLQFPVKELNLVLQACNPGEPLPPGDKRYEDLSALRQGKGLNPLCLDLITPLAENRYHHRCLCGHRGCGKTTELLALKEWADSQGFLTVHTEVDVHLGMIDLQFSDLFLLAATEVDEAMRKHGQALPEAKIKRVLEWFSEVMQEDSQTTKSEIAAEAGGQLGGSLPLGLGRLFGKLTAGIKSGSQHAETVRRKMKNYPDALIDLTNDLLAAANAILDTTGKPRGLLLLFDNLDRYAPEVVDSVLFRASELPRRLAAHAIFTLPMGLRAKAITPVPQDAYGFPVVLPMLALRRKGWSWAQTVAASQYDISAISAVRRALARRIDLDVLFEDQADVDLLVRVSGGCIRDLLHLLDLARQETSLGASRFSRAAVERGVRTMRSHYIDQLSSEHLTRLAEIAQRGSSPRDDVTNRLLDNRFALAYVDEKNESWIDIHPLVLEIEEFQHEFKDRSQLATS